jgi:hypothetical protein
MKPQSVAFDSEYTNPGKAFADGILEKSVEFVWISKKALMVKKLQVIKCPSRLKSFSQTPIACIHNTHSELTLKHAEQNLVFHGG